MIEVEKKFLLTSDEVARLTQNATFLVEWTFRDTYYDTADFSLSKSDKWLRSRDGKFELKVAVSSLGKKADQYDEITDEVKIREALQLSPGNNFSNDLKQNGIVPFCSFSTTRKKYKDDPFIIDLDLVDFTSFKYSIGEIELMVESKHDIENAVQQILHYAKEKDLKITPVRGKVVEYIRRTSPQHYSELIKAGIVEE